MKVFHHPFVKHVLLKRINLTSWAKDTSRKKKRFLTQISYRIRGKTNMQIVNLDILW